MQNKLTLFICCLLLISAGKTAFKSENKEITKYYVRVPAQDGVQKDFYISSIEVTNKQYRDFLNDLKQKGDIQKLQLAKVDSSKWLTLITYNELRAFESFYFQHPAYDNYPVVNVSKEAAGLYCQWLTEKYNTNAKLKVRFTLPSEEQWIQAAQGGNNSAIYPWQGNSLVYEKKGRFMNDAMFNYKHPHTPVGANNTNNPNVEITAPTKSYMPNAYGIYNMAGNVAELLSDKDYTKGGSWNSPPDKVTIQAKEEFSAACGPTVGFRPVMTICGPN